MVCNKYRKKIMLILTSLTMTISLSACGSGHQHEWERATCTEPRTCISCGEIDGEPKGHDWIEATETAPKTCNVCGKTEGEALTANNTVSEDTKSDDLGAVQSLHDMIGGKLYIGDEFTFGTYEQDNDLGNGSENIEWIVLDKTGENEYLCISKYVLDAQVFGKDGLEIRTRWSTSHLRKWLNDIFYNTAFTNEDAKCLVQMTTQYYTWMSPDDKKMSNDKTDDMVRVINYRELTEYPECVKVTEYAKAQGAPYIDDGTREHENCSDGWYTMTSDYDESVAYLEAQGNNAAPVNERGGIVWAMVVYEHKEHPYGYNYDSEPYYPLDGIDDDPMDKPEDYLEGVRPVITVTLQTTDNTSSAPSVDASIETQKDVDVKSLRDAVANELGENYYANADAPINLLENVGLTTDMYEELIFQMHMMGEADTLIIIKAKDGQVEAVKNALISYQASQPVDTIMRPWNKWIMQASMIETIDNYVCFVQLGGDNDRSSIEKDESDAFVTRCQEQNNLAIATIKYELTY